MMLKPFSHPKLFNLVPAMVGFFTIWFKTQALLKAKPKILGNEDNEYTTFRCRGLPLTALHCIVCKQMWRNLYRHIEVPEKSHMILCQHTRAFLSKGHNPSKPVWKPRRDVQVSRLTWLPQLIHRLFSGSFSNRLIIISFFSSSFTLLPIFPGCNKDWYQDHTQNHSLQKNAHICIGKHPKCTEQLKILRYTNF
jgi:hypothetical protein